MCHTLLPRTKHNIDGMPFKIYGEKFIFNINIFKQFGKPATVMTTVKFNLKLSYIYKTLMK